MSKTTNKVELVGHAGRDAAKQSENGPIKFSVVTGGEEKKDGGRFPAEWHTVVSWHIPEAADVKKGDLIRVIGRLHYSKWQGKDGTDRGAFEVVATTITINPQPEPQTPLTPSYTNQHGVAATSEDIPF